MPEFDERLLSKIDQILKQEDYSFDSFRQVLFGVCRQGKGLRINVYKQEKIYDKLLALKASSTHQNTIGISPYTITAATISEWILILSRFERSEYRTALLAYEAEMIANIDSLDLATISNVFVDLPKLSDSKKTITILANLLPHLINNRENQSVLTSKQISIILGGLKNIRYTNNTIEKLLAEILLHITENNQTQHWFETYDLASAFYGLQNIPTSAALENLTAGLLPHIKAHLKEGNRCGGQELGLLMQGLKNRSVDGTTASTLTAIAHYIETSQIEIEPGNIALILNGLQNMHNHQAVNTLLTAIIPRVAESDKQTRSLGLKEIEKALSGLQYLSDSIEAQRIVELFTMHIQIPKRETQTVYLRKWLANAIYLLTPYLSKTAPPSVQTIALNFIKRALKEFESVITLDINLEDFVDGATRSLAIIKVGGFMDEHAKKIDLSGYHSSVEVVKIIQLYLFNQAQEKGINWKVILDNDHYTESQQKAIKAVFPAVKDQTGPMITFKVLKPRPTSRPNKRPFQQITALEVTEKESSAKRSKNESWAKRPNIPPSPVSLC